MDKPGYRLLPAYLDHKARQTPSRPYASIPINNADLSAGFRDISYALFANAVNHAAHWLKSNLPESSISFQTIAYVGPKDLRYPIMAVAAAKISMKLMVPHPNMNHVALAHLIRTTECKTIFFAKAFENFANDLVVKAGDQDVRAVQVPEQEEWLKEEKADDVPYDKSWEEGKNDPWLVFHSSGTTGPPKPLIHTMEMMAAVDAVHLLPEVRSDETAILSHADGRRWFTPLPTLHIVGMLFALELTVYANATLVLGAPEAGPLDVQSSMDTIRYGKVNVGTLPPMFMDQLASDPIGIRLLQGLEVCYYGGAALSQDTAQKLQPFVNIKTAMGTTEAGIYWMKMRGDEEDWEYMSFWDANGFEFEHVDENLFELVTIRKPELERFQLQFKLKPGVDRIPSGDLFVEHKEKKGAWKYMGRTDDMLGFSHGNKLKAQPYELQVQQCPGVLSLVVGGAGRSGPYLLVEWKEEEVDDATKLQQLWPYVEQANEKCLEYIRVTKERILFTKPGKALVKTSKSTSSRRQSEELYAKEIDALYA